MALLALLISSLLLSGCAALDDFWDKEFLAVYAPGSLHEKEKSRVAEPLNYWLGQPKSERIRVMGAPDKCTALKTGEETCEWAHGGSASESHIAFTYDGSGIARSWNYYGTLGQFTSENYMRKSTAAASSTDSQQSRKKWTHPTKAEAEFSRDYFQCQTDVQRDPKGMTGAGPKSLLQGATESCLKQQGWVQSGKR